MSHLLALQEGEVHVACSDAHDRELKKLEAHEIIDEIVALLVLKHEDPLRFDRDELDRWVAALRERTE